MESSYTEPPPKATEMLPPQPCTDFNTARLFLSHFGFLSRLDDTNVIILFTEEIVPACVVFMLLTLNMANVMFRIIDFDLLFLTFYCIDRKTIPMLCVKSKTP